MKHPNEAMKHPNEAMKHPDEAMKHPDEAMKHPDEAMKHPDEAMKHPDEAMKPGLGSWPKLGWLRLQLRSLKNFICKLQLLLRRHFLIL